eukprot:1158639-Pelagomonas_calceolata.AAC.4
MWARFLSQANRPTKEVAAAAAVAAVRSRSRQQFPSLDEQLCLALTCLLSFKSPLDCLYSTATGNIAQATILQTRGREPCAVQHPGLAPTLPQLPENPAVHDEGTGCKVVKVLCPADVETSVSLSCYAVQQCIPFGSREIKLCFEESRFAPLACSSQMPTRSSSLGAVAELLILMSMASTSKREA